MGILGGRHVGVFEGHTIELVQDNLAKLLKLVVDGVTLASEDRRVPHDITLTATFAHAGATHRLVGRSLVTGLATKDTIELDGKPLSITR